MSQVHQYKKVKCYWKFYDSIFKLIIPMTTNQMVYFQRHLEVGFYELHGLKDYCLQNNLNLVGEYVPDNCCYSSL